MPFSQAIKQTTHRTMWLLWAAKPSALELVHLSNVETRFKCRKLRLMNVHYSIFSDILSIFWFILFFLLPKNMSHHSARAIRFRHLSIFAIYMNWISYWQAIQFWSMVFAIFQAFITIIADLRAMSSIVGGWTTTVIQLQHQNYQCKLIRHVMRWVIDSLNGGMYYIVQTLMSSPNTQILCQTCVTSNFILFIYVQAITSLTKYIRSVEARQTMFEDNLHVQFNMPIANSVMLYTKRKYLVVLLCRAFRFVVFIRDPYHTQSKLKNTNFQQMKCLHFFPSCCPIRSYPSLSTFWCCNVWITLRLRITVYSCVEHALVTSSDCMCGVSVLLYCGRLRSDQLEWEMIRPISACK